jgi:hypothetical protein
VLALVNGKVKTAIAKKSTVLMFHKVKFAVMERAFKPTANSVILASANKAGEDPMTLKLAPLMLMSAMK